MLWSPEVGASAHPYWYVQVIGIYHAHVSTTHLAAPKHSAQRMEFLWVRWLGIEPGHRSGSKAARLPKVGFVKATDEDAFGFLDPNLIIRGSHLIPDFHSGRTSDLMPYDGPTIARCPDEKALGARTPITSRHMLNTLRIQSLNDHNVSSGRKSDTFKMYPVM